MTMSVHEQEQVVTASTAVVASPSKLHVNQSCLEVLRYLKECGLLEYCNDETSIDHDDRLVASWCSSSSNGSDNKVKFDEDGFVSSLDLGGKRLYRGFPIPGKTAPTATGNKTRMVLPPFDKFQRLKTLNLAGTDLPLNDTMKVLEMIQSTIEVLFLGGNGLGVAGGKAIASWLSGLAGGGGGRSHLAKLDLRYNDLGDEGMTSLCCDGLMKMTGTGTEALGDCCNVRHLYVEGNDIGDSGVDALARLLNHQGNVSKETAGSESYGIREVYLGANKIRHVGAQSLASTLHTNKMISKIYLEGNQIGLQGANAFSEVLEQLNGNTSLQQLFVDNNNIGKEGSKRLAQALNSGTSIGDMIDT
mmetsp:Transcript_55688/g.134964  ORF Transcript_55688/g.134964 Transcript_55688/m.134964 type:complete len:360 (+) Transcript_55688:33-1112(+)